MTSKRDDSIILDQKLCYVQNPEIVWRDVSVHLLNHGQNGSIGVDLEQSGLTQSQSGVNWDYQG